jgi:hypothetical protein
LHQLILEGSRDNHTGTIVPLLPCETPDSPTKNKKKSLRVMRKRSDRRNWKRWGSGGMVALRRRLNMSVDLSTGHLNIQVFGVANDARQHLVPSVTHCVENYSVESVDGAILRVLEECMEVPISTQIVKQLLDRYVERIQAEIKQGNVTLQALGITQANHAALPKVVSSPRAGRGKAHTIVERITIASTSRSGLRKERGGGEDRAPHPLAQMLADIKQHPSFKGGGAEGKTLLHHVSARGGESGGSPQQEANTTAHDRLVDQVPCSLCTVLTTL